MKKFTLLLALVLFAFLANAQVTGDFRSISAGPSNWNDFNSWERYDGSSWLAATAGQLPTASSNVEIRAGHTIAINAAALTSGNLTINGSLNYDVATVSALTVSGSVTVNAGGNFTSPASGSVVTHSLNIGGSTAAGVGGNLKVDGTFNMNVFASAGVGVTFYGTPNDSIYGAGTINFYSLTVNKGTNINSILNVASVITIAPPVTTGTRMTITSGTLKISSVSVLSPYIGDQAVCSGRLWLNNTGAVVQRVGTTAGRPFVYGTLQIDAGTFTYGSGTEQFVTQGTIIMNGPDAVMNLNCSFNLSTASNFTMNAGNINIFGNGSTSSSFYVYNSFLMTNTFNFTGGTITIVDPPSSSAALALDFSISGTLTYTNTGTFRFGNGTSNLAGSVNGFQVKMGTFALNNVIVANNPSSVLTTRIVKLTTNTTINGNLTINAGTANQFLLNGYSLTLNGNLSNAGTFNGDGAAANNLILTGTNQQVISGAGTFTNGNINNLTINNTSGATPAVDLQKNLSVSNGLTLTKGTLGSTNASVFTIGRSASSVTFLLTRSGGSLGLTPVFNFTGVTTINYTYPAPVPAASTTTSVELPAGQAIATFTIGNTSGVILDKPVSCTTLSLTGILTTTAINTVLVTGSTAASVAGGSATAYVNGPLTRTIPNNAAAANYRFPVGKTSFQLFEFASLTTGGTGTTTFTVEAFDQGPYTATAGTGLSAVNTDKYWRLSTTLGTVTINSSSTVRLTDGTLTSFSKIGQSNVATGTYNSIGGTVSASTITSGSSFDQSNLTGGTFFRVGTASAFAAGIYAIGPQASYAGYAGTFPSMTSAVAAMTSAPFPGNVIFEFQPDYLPAVETYPVNFTANIFSTSTATIIFRPAASVSSLINFSSASAIINNTGTDYLTFDGRNGGTGTNRYLKFTTTSTTLGAVTVGTNSPYNTFKYCLFKGSTTAASTGVFTVGPNLNTGLQIIHCDFDASNAANSCLFFTTGVPDIIISNSDFYNFRIGYGIYVPAGSTNAVVDSCNVFQTTAYNGIAGTSTGIYVNGSTNSRISNNNVGGSGSGLTGIWTITSTTPVAYNFVGINVASMGTGSKVYQNKIGKFDWKCSTCTWTGISASGSGNIGTDGTNFIGDSLGTDNIKVTYYAAGTPTFVAISSGGTVPVENNVIGSITTALSGITTTGSSFTGITNSGSGAINNNIVGSRVTPNSINIAAQSTGTSAQNVYGIHFPGTGTLNITNNIVANIKNGSTVVSGSTRGIWIPNYGSVANITGNKVFSITTSQPVLGASSGCLDGINSQASNAVNNISGNLIYDLVNTSATAAVGVNGIYYNAGTGVNNKIEKNLVHGIITSSNTAIQNGINFSYGVCTIQNNVIRLGIDKDGNSISTTAQINGIYKASTTAGAFNLYFNTIYIGGSGVAAGAVMTRGININNHTTEDIRNNIVVNLRTNTVANPVHYAFALPTGITSGYTCDYNIYQVSATDGRLARIGATDYTNMGALIAALPGSETHSGFGNPMLTSPASAMATMDLKPLNFTPAESNGISIVSVTDDFTGAARSGLTPVDIGAYSGNFTPAAAANDIFFPLISYTPLINTGSTSNRIISNFAFVTDYFTGVDTAIGNRPRIYYKKSTDANAFAGNTSADNGWKWTQAQDNDSPFNFTIDYSIINGGSVAVGDVIQYFVVAQDKATTPNVTFNPSNGAIGSSVNSTGMTAPGTPNSYTIFPTIGPAVNVGTGYPYTTLTGTLASGGLFAAINAGVLTSNVVATIKTDIVEPGTIALNEIIEEGAGAGTYSLTIQSDGLAHLVSGGTSFYNLPLIPINGADRVIIDGGTGKYLKFRNAYATTWNYTGPVIQFDNGSQNCTVTNCILESCAYAIQPPDPTVAAEIVIGKTGVNSVTIDHNDLRDSRAGYVGTMRTAVFSNSVSNSVFITNNNIYNFRSPGASEIGYGIYLNAVANGAVITGNSFYQETGFNPTSGLYAIYINGGNSHNISNNYIGGSGPQCSGTWTGTTSVSYPTYGIYLVNGTAPASTIQGNTFSSFTFPASGYFTGIATSASVANITGNTIGSATVSNSIQFNGGVSYGVYVTTPPSPCIIEGNTVANVTITTNVTPSFYGIYSSGGTVSKNKVFNLGASLANSTPNIYGIYNASGFATNEFSNNMISLTGGASNNPSLVGFYDVSNATTSNINFYFNSISISGTSSGASSSFAFRRNQNTPMVLRDNILSNTRTGGTGVHYAIYAVTSASLSSDYNDLYVSGSTLGYYVSAKSNFAAWQAIPMDLNSYNVNPVFSSETDLHTSIVQLNNAGQNIPAVTTDLSNITRSNPPDIGAYEFTMPITAIHTLTTSNKGMTWGVVNGDINTSNEVVSMSFDYGLTTSYGSNSAATPASVRSTSITSVMDSITGLLPGTTYHYRVTGVSTSSAETVYGADSTFTTLNALIAGPDTVCAGSTGNIYSVQAGFFNYNWVISAGGTIAAGGTPGDNTVTVTWNTAGPNSVSVTYEFPAGVPATAPAPLPVLVNPSLPVSVTIGAVPSGTICHGTNVTFTATPVNGGTSPSYQWLKGVTPVGTNNPVFSSSTLLTGDVISVVLTSNETCQSGPDTSNLVTMTIADSLIAPVAGTSHSVCFGGLTTTLTATPSTGGSGPVGYQWQESFDGIVWADVTGETTLSYSPGNLFATVSYRVQATDNGTPSCGIVYSNVVTVTVNDPLSPSVISANQTVCYNTAPAQLTGTLPTGGSGPYGYQWQSRTTGGFSNIGGASSINYQPGLLTQNTQYRMIINDLGTPSCGSTISNTVTITVQSAVIAGSIAANQLICSGQTTAPLTSVTPGSGSGTITYTWESSTDAGVNWTIIPGESGLGYTPGILTQTTLFHRVTISTLGGVECRAVTPDVTINVNQTLTADFSASNTTPPINTDVTFTDATTGGPVAWNWTFTPGTVVYTNGTSSTSQNPVVQFTTNGHYTVELTATNAPCTSTMTKTDYINMGTTGLWSGSTSGNWAISSNWDDFVVPGINTDVVIPASAANWPVFSGDFYVGNECNSLTLAAASSVFNVTGSFFILNDHAVTNAGTINIAGDFVIPISGTATVPVVTTAGTTNITLTSAVTGGRVISDGGLPVSERGICYSTSPLPTTADIKVVVNPADTGSFVVNLSGLTSFTTFYVRAYAINILGTSYGNEVTFSTSGILPTVTTNVVSLITGTTARSGGNVTSDGGLMITERGICYSTSSNPTIANSKVIDPAPGTGVFISNMTGLTGNTVYHVRSYATNGMGTAYGNDVNFTTLVAPPVLVTAAPTSITGATVTSGGTMTANGTGGNLWDYGVCYSTIPNDPSPTYVQTGQWPTPPLTYVTNITGLLSSTTYYIRATIHGSWNLVNGVVYGNELSFTTTSATPPVMAATTAITGLSANNATTGGTVSNNGGSSITAKGVCWSTSPNPILGTDNFTTDGIGNNGFISQITGLTATTTYYVRSYATNIIGTGYGPELSFTTWVQAPYFLGENVGYGYCAYVAPDGTGFIVSGDIPSTLPWGCSGTSIATSALLGTGQANTNLILANCATRPIAASIADAYSVTYGGYTYADWYLPSAGEWQKIGQVGNLVGLGGAGTNNYYTSSQTSATYVSSWFTNYNNGYSSGASKLAGINDYVYYLRVIRSFTAATPATVTTAPISNIGPSGATCGGDVTSDGGAPVSAHGVCWSTVTAPTIADPKTNDGPGIGPFISTIGGLALNTTYFVRAYATNISGTVYGSEVSFTTAAVANAPTVTTDPISASTPTSVTTGGNVSTDGGDPVTAYGICWGTATAPTIAGSHNTEGTGIGSFVSTLTGLVSGTTYYMRAYATNGVGTSYGNEISFTAGLPILTTEILTSAGSLASSFGTYFSGGDPVTETGVCWSTSPAPTIAGTHSVDPFVQDAFISNLTGLTVGNTYYVRTYATNSTGTGYGNEVTFVASAAVAGQYVYFSNGYDGIILSTDGTNGIIASAWDFGTTDWGCSSSVTGATGTATGTGLSNTNLIVNDIITNSCISANGVFAAEIPGSWIGPEWYLPSKDEVDLLISTSGVTFLPVAGLQIWSSSEISATNAWLYDGTVWTGSLKTVSNTVWPIRSF